MSKIRLLALVFLAAIVVLATASRAAEPERKTPAFTWPAAYAASWRQVCSSGTFTETYRIDGLNARTDTKSDKLEFSMIFNGNLKRAVIVDKGVVHGFSFSDLKMNASTPPAPPFPTDGQWENLGADTVDGKAAVKYKVTITKPVDTSFTVWLSPDGKMPLHLQSKTETLTFISYKPGPQDPRLFLPPEKK